MLAGWESFSATPYKDSAGVWTIGFGHAMFKGITIQSLTLDQAKALLAQDLLPVITAVKSAVVVPLSQYQFDALVIFAYNVGITAFKTSTLLRLLNAGNTEGAGAQFAVWNKAGGVVCPGLVRRRAAEANLFSCAQYTLHA